MSPRAPQLHFAVLAADTVLFTLRNEELLVRLISVQASSAYPRHKGLPGGLLQPKETAEQAALRHLEQKACITIKNVYHEQLYTFSAIDRDPRGRVVAVAYLALVPWEALSLAEQVAEPDAGWYPAKKLPRLAYDHAEIIRVASERLRSKIVYSTLIAKLLPKEFTLTELEKAYVAILEQPIDKRNFRKKILRQGFVEQLNKQRTGLKQRPASLFRFTSQTVQLIEVL